MKTIGEVSAVPGTGSAQNKKSGQKNVELLFEEKNPRKEAMHKILRCRVNLIKKKGCKEEKYNSFWSFLGITLCRERKGEEFVNPSLKNKKSIR